MLNRYRHDQLHTVFPRILEHATIYETTTFWRWVKWTSIEWHAPNYSGTRAYIENIGQTDQRTKRMKRTWSCWRLKNIESLLLENRTFLFSTRGFHTNFGFWKIERFQVRTWFLFEFWVSLLVACHYVRSTTISFDLFFWRFWTLQMEHAPNSRIRT